MRALPKRHIGSVTPHIRFKAFFDGKVAPQWAYAAKQAGQDTFVLVDEATGLLSQRCKLVYGTPTAPGQCQVTVTTATSTVESVRRIYYNVVMTYEDNEYQWMFNAATLTAGQANISSN